VRKGEEKLIIFFTCNVTKKYFVALFFISLRYVIRYVTIFNFSLRYRVTLHKFFVMLRFFRYVSFRVQIPDVKNTFECVDKIKDVHIMPYDMLVLFDVDALFPSIPVDEVLEVLEEQHLNLDVLTQYLELAKLVMK
jgi:hypothetical protein